MTELLSFDSRRLVPLAALVLGFRSSCDLSSTWSKIIRRFTSVCIARICGSRGVLPRLTGTPETSSCDDAQLTSLDRQALTRRR